MGKQKFNLKEHKNYVAFLEKKLNSQNYKNNVSKEEHQKTKEKYDKAKLILKLYE